MELIDNIHIDIRENDETWVDVMKDEYVVFSYKYDFTDNSFNLNNEENSNYKLNDYQTNIITIILTSYYVNDILLVTPLSSLLSIFKQRLLINIILDLSANRNPIPLTFEDYYYTNSSDEKLSAYNDLFSEVDLRPDDLDFDQINLFEYDNQNTEILFNFKQKIISSLL